MLELLIVFLLLAWLLGFLGSIGGGFIHLLLVLALVALIYRLLVGPLG